MMLVRPHHRRPAKSLQTPGYLVADGTSVAPLRQHRDDVGGRGSHRIFVRRGVTELLNLQEIHGQAKPYQVRQVAAVIRRYNLQLEHER
jgi:hypothetical protein